MAARRTQVGLRCRGSGLSWPSSFTDPDRPSPAPSGSGADPGFAKRRPEPGRSRAARLLLAVGLAWATLPGCVGLSDEDTNILSLHQQNSTLFFQQRDYRKALHQASKALTFDDSQVGMRIIKGFCLTKLGASQGTVSELDEAIEIFEDLKPGRGGEDYRTWLGSGEAHMARALRHQQAAERIERRLASDFLTEDGRDLEQAQVDDEFEGRAHHLAKSEHDLRRVLDFPLHGDNTYALLDLIVTVNMQGDRNEESAMLCRRAIELLVEGIDLTRETLNDGIRLAPAKKIGLQRRIDDALSKERQLRQILVTIEFSRGSYQRSLSCLAALEDRQLMTSADHLLRADIFEKLGMLPAALDELDVFLRLRSRYAEYDDVASETLHRAEELRAKIAAGS